MLQWRFLIVGLGTAIAAFGGLAEFFVDGSCGWSW